MAKVIITQALREEILKKFKSLSKKIFYLMKSLESQPKKGKALSHVEEVVIKELKYEKFRFFFITDGHVLKFGTEDELASLLIKFVRMSAKKDQQKAINEIRSILKTLGFKGF